MIHINAGSIAPSFSLQGPDATEYSLAALFQNNPVVAAFFKVSCPVCQFTFPFLERLYERYGGAATFLGISQDDSRATEKFAAEYGITFPLALDTKGYATSNAYGLTNVPTIFLIETDGSVKLISMGFVKKDLEAIASKLGHRAKVATVPLFLPGEPVPANKPG